MSGYNNIDAILESDRKAKRPDMYPEFPEEAWAWEWDEDE